MAIPELALESSARSACRTRKMMGPSWAFRPPGTGKGRRRAEKKNTRRKRTELLLKSPGMG